MERLNGGTHEYWVLPYDGALTKASKSVAYFYKYCQDYFGSKKKYSN